MPSRLNDHFASLCRMSLGGSALALWLVLVADPRPSLASIAQSRDGIVLLWLMGMAALAVVLDVILNDWTPQTLCIGRLRWRLSWRRAFHYRHLLFVTLAFCYAAQPFVARGNGLSVPLLIFFYWQSLLNLTIAFFDARQRSRSYGWQRASS